MMNDRHPVTGLMNSFARIIRLSGLGEPFRMLFPLGMVLGMLGVLLWPAFVYGWLPFYPGVIHSRIMVQGFIFSFMAGFLGSALPHMLEIQGMSLRQTLVLSVMIISAALLHVFGYSPPADCLFAVTIITLLTFMLRHWNERQDLPPPGIVLAALGMISGVISAILLAIYPGYTFPRALYLLAKTLLNHGFILFPVLGLGSYLLPRMFGIPNRHLISKSRTITAAWKSRALFMLGCGAFLMMSFVLEAIGLFRWAFALRFVTAMFCLLHEVPLFRAGKIKGSVPWSLMIAVISILAGYLLLAIWPHRQTSMIHVVFISGFGLLILNIGARVVLGHSGNTDLIYQRQRAVNWIAGLVILAMATRVSADLIPKMQLSHYAYAGITWGLISVIWLTKFAPYLSMTVEAEPSVK